MAHPHQCLRGYSKMTVNVILTYYTRILLLDLTYYDLSLGIFAQTIIDLRTDSRLYNSSLLIAGPSKGVPAGEQYSTAGMLPCPPIVDFAIRLECVSATDAAARSTAATFSPGHVATYRLGCTHHAVSSLSAIVSHPRQSYRRRRPSPNQVRFLSAWLTLTSSHCMYVLYIREIRDEKYIERHKTIMLFTCAKKLPKSQQQ